MHPACMGEGECGHEDQFVCGWEVIQCDSDSVTEGFITSYLMWSEMCNFTGNFIFIFDAVTVVHCLMPTHFVLLTAARGSSGGL